MDRSTFAIGLIRMLYDVNLHRKLNINRIVKKYFNNTVCSTSIDLSKKNLPDQYKTNLIQQLYN